jgi:hypothetical protein
VFIYQLLSIRVGFYGQLYEKLLSPTDFCNLSKPSSRTIALGPTQPLTEMSTKKFPCGKGRPECKSDNLTAICEPDFLEKMWEPLRLTTLWAFMACYRDSFTLHFTCTLIHFSGRTEIRKDTQQCLDFPMSKVCCYSVKDTMNL